MKSKKLFRLVLIASISSLVLFSCRRDKKEEEQPSPIDNETQSASNNALAEGIYNDVHNMSDQAVNDGNLTTYKIAGSLEDMALTCVDTIIRDTVSSPRRTIIDFGTDNTICQDGKVRKGKIIISHTGRYRDSATVITTTFDEFFVNNNKVMGTKTVTNKGRNSLGQPTYTINVNGSILLANGTGTLTWSSARTRVWTQGYNTLFWNDDVYSITGSASGTTAAGKSFDMQITTALIKQIGCRHFVSGKFDFTPQTKPTRTIDYGSGTCDNNATVTINGTTYPITLN